MLESRKRSECRQTAQCVKQPCPLWAGCGHLVGRAQPCKVKIHVPQRRMSAESPDLRCCLGNCIRVFGSVANFGKLRIHALRRTQLSSERRELLECGLARRLELSLADHVRDFDAFQGRRG